MSVSGTAHAWDVQVQCLDVDAVLSTGAPAVLCKVFRDAAFGALHRLRETVNDNVRNGMRVMQQGSPADIGSGGNTEAAVCSVVQDVWHSTLQDAAQWKARVFDEYLVEVCWHARHTMSAPCVSQHEEHSQHTNTECLDTLVDLALTAVHQQCRAVQDDTGGASGATHTQCGTSVVRAALYALYRDASVQLSFDALCGDPRMVHLVACNAVYTALWSTVVAHSRAAAEQHSKGSDAAACGGSKGSDADSDASKVVVHAHGAHTSLDAGVIRGHMRQVSPDVPHRVTNHAVSDTVLHPHDSVSQCMAGHAQGAALPTLSILSKHTSDNK